MTSIKLMFSKLHFLKWILLPLILVSCDMRKEFSLDGFKDIKFGITVSELTILGVNCGNEINEEVTTSPCEMSDEAKTKFTLFGQETRLQVKATEAKVAIILVYIDFSPDYLIEKFASSLGTPKVYSYVSITGNNINKYYWLSKDGTAIVVSKNLDYNESIDSVDVLGVAVKTKKHSFASAEYLNRVETTEFLKYVPQELAYVKDDF